MDIIRGERGTSRKQRTPRNITKAMRKPPANIALKLSENHRKTAQQQPFKWWFFFVLEYQKNRATAIERGLEPDDKRRVEAAIEAHKTETNRIQSLLDRQ